MTFICLQCIKSCIINTRLRSCLEVLLAGRLRDLQLLPSAERARVALSIKESLDRLLTLADETKMALSAAIRKDLVKFVPSGKK